MLYKYLKLMLFSTVLVQASPKLFNSYGNQIEAFQKDCQTYRKLSLIPKHIKKKCKIYNSQVNRAFKYGYKLDPYGNEVSYDNAEKYNQYLHKLEEKKDNILYLIYKDKKKALEQVNTKYYGQIITAKSVNISSVDYEFMNKNKNKFKENPKYLMYERNLYAQEIIHLKKEKVAIHLKHKEKVASLEKENDAISLVKKAQEYKHQSILLKHREGVERIEKEKKTIRLEYERLKKEKETSRIKHEEKVASLEKEKKTIHLEYVHLKKENDVIRLRHKEEIASLEKEKRTIHLEYERLKKENDVMSLKKAKEKEKIRQAKEKIRREKIRQENIKHEKIRQAKEEEKIRQAKEKKSYKSSTTRSRSRPINSTPAMLDVDLFNRCMDSCNRATLGLPVEKAFNVCSNKCLRI